MSVRNAMRSTSVRFGAVFVVVLLVGLVAPATAVAAGPSIERVQVDEEFEDEFLSDICGVQVITRITGFFIARQFDRDTTGPLEVFTINVNFTATSPYGVARFRDVGGDLLRIAPDGSLLVQLMGQIPFGFAGVLKLNLDTDEVLHEPRDRSDWQVAKVCGALTG